MVASNANGVAIAATAFLKAAKSLNYRIISQGIINALVNDAGKIYETTDIRKQRAYFANFSPKMVTVSKEVKLPDSLFTMPGAQLLKHIG